MAQGVYTKVYKCGAEESKICINVRLNAKKTHKK